MAQIELVERRSVGRQPVSRDRLRLDRLVVKEALQKSGRRLCVPPALDYEIEDLALIIDRPPQVHPLAADPADHLVQVPARRRLRPASLQPLGDQGAKLDGPAADRLVADVDPSLREKLLDVPKTEAEPEVQPHGVAYDVPRKPVALGGLRFQRCEARNAAARALLIASLEAGSPTCAVDTTNTLAASG